jgi:hypothetical protein
MTRRRGQWPRSQSLSCRARRGRCGRHGAAALPGGDSSAIGHRWARAASDFACCLAARWRQACVPRGHLSGSVSLLRRDADPRWVRGDDAGNRPRSATCKASGRDGATGRDEVGSGDAGVAIPWLMWAPPTLRRRHASSSRQTRQLALAPPPSGVVLAEATPPCQMTARGALTCGLVGAEGLEPPTPAL